MRPPEISNPRLVPNATQIASRRALQFEAADGMGLERGEVDDLRMRRWTRSSLSGSILREFPNPQKNLLQAMDTKFQPRIANPLSELSSILSQSVSSPTRVHRERVTETYLERSIIHLVSTSLPLRASNSLKLCCEFLLQPSLFSKDLA